MGALSSPSMRREERENDIKPVEPLWKRIVKNMAFQVAVAAFLGICGGITMSQLGAPEKAPDVVKWFKAPGLLFIDILKCIVVPMLFVNIFTVAADLMDNGEAMAIGWRTVTLYLFTSFCASLQALLWTLFFFYFELIPRNTPMVSYDKPTVNFECPYKDATGAPQYLTIDRETGTPSCQPMAAGDEASIEPTDKTGLQFFKINELSKFLVTNEDRLKAANAKVSVTDQLINGVLKTLVPSNMFHAFLNNNFLGIIFIAIFLAAAASSMKGKDRPTAVFKLFRQLNDVLSRGIAGIIAIAPLAVFFLCVGSFGDKSDLASIFQHLGILIAVSLLAMFSHACIFLPLQYLVLARGNPFAHIWHFLPAQAIAFSAGSSPAALPMNKKCANSRGGIAPHIRDFVLSVGATINMDGSAIYTTAVTIFLGLQGDLLNTGAADKYALTIILATLGSAGSAPVPSFGLVVIVICYNTVYGKSGTPDAFALIISINWLMDRFVTLVNSTGDAFSVGIMAKWDNTSWKTFQGEYASGEVGFGAIEDAAAKEYSV